MFARKTCGLAEYDILQNFFRDFYEPWALIRHDECIGLSGALMALSVLDCNLVLDQVQLGNQPT